MNNKKTIFAIFGSLVIIIGISIGMFFAAMTPDENLEKEARESAEVYLNQYYSEAMEIRDIYFDKMDKYADFEYAAEVTNTTNGIEFLVYQNRNTGEMEDTYAENVFEEELHHLIKPKIEKRFGDAEAVKVNYFLGEDQRKYRQAIDLPPVNLVPVSPTVTIVLPREQKDGDEGKLKEIVHVMKTDLEVKHATVKLQFQPEDAETETLLKEY